MFRLRGIVRQVSQSARRRPLGEPLAATRAGVRQVRWRCRAERRSFSSLGEHHAVVDLRDAVGHDAGFGTEGARGSGDDEDEDGGEECVLDQIVPQLFAQPRPKLLIPESASHHGDHPVTGLSSSLQQGCEAGVKDACGLREGSGKNGERGAGVPENKFSGWEE